VYLLFARRSVPGEITTPALPGPSQPAASHSQS
jgi:hypothetical protein